MFKRRDLGDEWEELDRPGKSGSSPSRGENSAATEPLAIKYKMHHCPDKEKKG